MFLVLEVLEDIPRPRRPGSSSNGALQNSLRAVDLGIWLWGEVALTRGWRQLCPRSTHES